MKPGTATIRYTIPTPLDSPIGGATAAKSGLRNPVMSTPRSGWPKATVLRTSRWEVSL